MDFEKMESMNNKWVAETNSNENTLKNKKVPKPKIHANHSTKK